MYKLLRYYNQNKRRILLVLLVVIFGYFIIRVLDTNAKNKKTREEKETTSNVVSYSNESKSMVSGGSVTNAYSEDFGKFINQFFTYCTEHNVHAAYSMLSSDTKQELYQTEELFKKNYYESRFSGDKQFSFQSWSSSNKLYIYQVKIFDNMLSTGKTSDNYIEEYATVSSEEDEYKINLNSYLGKKIINKKTENDDISIQVLKVDRYLDYEVYTLSIQNKEDSSILLDTRRKNNTCYIQDSLSNKFEAVLYENKDEDLKFAPNEMKTIRIKFSDANRENLEIKSINFTDIVYNSEYSKNPKIEGKSFKIDI